MNNEIFQKAKEAYDNKDYEAALNGFTECLQDNSQSFAPGEMGLLYHQIGNSLVKLRDYNEAIHAYTQATIDSAYDDTGSVNNNLGMCYAALNDYEDAVKFFEIAVSDAKYATPYKAYNGMGNSLLKLGKSAEAGVAFRQAALDENNPDPTKALLNLGVCFMALGRPQDAVASYESALQFDMSQDLKNKLCANLGQAYVASGQMQKAVTAFESAIADKTYFLSDSASVDYQRAVGAVASASAQETQALTPLDADMSGLDVTSDGEPLAQTDGQIVAASNSDPMEMNEISQGEDHFFNASDEELEQWSKGMSKKGRKRVGLRIFVVILILLALAAGAAAFLYSQGFGYPQQETVVQQLFSDKDAAADSVFVKDLSAEKKKTLLAPIVEDSNVTIDGVNKSMNESEVYATAQTSDGGEVQYKITLIRSDLIGWKVSNVELYFASQNSDS